MGESLLTNITAIRQTTTPAEKGADGGTTNVRAAGPDTAAPQTAAHPRRDRAGGSITMRTRIFIRLRYLRSICERAQQHLQVVLKLHVVQGSILLWNVVLFQDALVPRFLESILHAGGQSLILVHAHSHSHRSPKPFAHVHTARQSHAAALSSAPRCPLRTQNTGLRLHVPRTYIILATPEHVTVFLENTPHAVLFTRSHHLTGVSLRLLLHAPRIGGA